MRNDHTKALKVSDAIYQGIGWGNTFMVTTSEGNHYQIRVCGHSRPSQSPADRR